VLFAPSIDTFHNQLIHGMEMPAPYFLLDQPFGIEFQFTVTPSTWPHPSRNASGENPTITTSAQLFLPAFPHKLPNPPPPTEILGLKLKSGTPMSSQRKINSARANGAKSHGPKTDAGRKASSLNAVTHGLYAKGVILANESSEEHKEMLASYTQQFHPEGRAEMDLVEEMVAAKWRQRRLWAIETDLLEDEMLQQTEKLDQDGTSYDPITPLSFAYDALASKSLPFLSRHESRLERTYYRALKTLLELRRLRNQNIQKRTESQIRPPQLRPTRNQEPETRNQKPATSNQPPATSHQPPATIGQLTHPPPIR
jgi:hypothetical protein